MGEPFNQSCRNTKPLLKSIRQRCTLSSCGQENYHTQYIICAQENVIRQMRLKQMPLSKMRSGKCGSGKCGSGKCAQANTAQANALRQNPAQAAQVPSACHHSFSPNPAQAAQAPSACHHYFHQNPAQAAQAGSFAIRWEMTPLFRTLGGTHQHDKKRVQDCPKQHTYFLSVEMRLR